MIHIELSVEPHSKHVVWGEDLRPINGSPPPHVVMERSFRKAHAAIIFIGWLGLSPKMKEEAVGVINMARTEYVGVEQQLMEMTDTEYTGAFLNIEGKEE